MPFQPGNQEAKKGVKRRRVREALEIEIELAEKGEETPAPPGSLRYAARQLIVRAATETPAWKELADRLDGKAIQPISGIDDDDNPAPIVPIINITSGT